ALPPGIHNAVNRLENRSELLEIVMDLGRFAEGRFPEGEVILSTQPITSADLEYVVERIGEFGDDNRAGIERTLHRISALRNRKGKVVGLTCRIGRAVLVIDEIGTELEAAAARTIAGRGVQLVATAHGNSLGNLLVNPTLSDLVGGIQTVTLGDEEARRRHTQKSILERKAPPTFDVVV